VRQVCPAQSRPLLRPSAQAAAVAADMLLAVGSCESLLPAAKALLATLAKLLAPAHVPGAAVRAGLSVRRSHTMHTSRASHMPRASMRAPESDLLPGVRQDALMASVPDLICPTPRTQAAGRVLPAALLPYAVAQLLPLLLLPPERVRALHVALIQRVNNHSDGVVSGCLSRRLVRPQPSR